MIKHLKDRKHYEDRYDRNTVEQGLWHEKFAEDLSKDPECPSGAARLYSVVNAYFYAGDRYLKRESTINKWIEEDRKRDDMVKNTPVPFVNCFMCNDLMQYMDKTLSTDLENETFYVEFFFACKECQVFTDFSSKGHKNRIPWQCPDCKRRLEKNTIRKKKKLVTKKLCQFCGYSDEYVLDLSFKSERKKRLSKEELRKFREDKLRFCLSEEYGLKYQESKRRLEQLKEVVDSVEKQKEAPKVKVLSIKQVQGLLKKVLTTSGCENVNFSNPNLNRDVVFQFKAIDSNDRNAWDARKLIKKAIEVGLQGTNWNLMSEGVSYRLGILTGRIRGQEVKDNSRSDIIY